jgi:hypothetical protein
MMSDHFVKERQDLPLYSNKSHMIQAIKLVVSDIMIMTKVTIDFDRTKQLAHVLY